MTIDFDVAARFLAALAPDETHTFQTFDDTGRGRSLLSRIVHGSFTDLASTLARANFDQAGVFVLVNAGDGRGRKRSNVKAVRAVFLDLDGSPLQPAQDAPVPPDIVCESSPGKHHVYWLVSDMPLEAFTSAQKALAKQYGGDHAVCDLPRVMRLPGFMHMKNPANPTRVKLLSINPHFTPHPWPAFSEAMGLCQPRCPRPIWKLPSRIFEGERNSTLRTLALHCRQGGIGQDAILRRVREVNKQRCTPPLAVAEVNGIVTRALDVPLAGFIAIPYAVMDSGAYRALTVGARAVLDVAYRRFTGDNNGNISLPWSFCRDWLPCSEDTFERWRREVIQSGLLVETRPPQKSAPGRKPACGLYSLPFVIHTRMGKGNAGVEYPRSRASLVDKQGIK